jgi:hypothetical protein
MKYETAKKKADLLLVLGDTAIAAGNKAEGKRLLRKCRRLRKIRPTTRKE